MDHLRDVAIALTAEWPAVVTGVLLWLVLPRAAVLVRSMLTQYPDGTPRYDTWEVRNDSAVAVRIRWAAYMGAETSDDVRNRLNWVEMPTNADDKGLLVTLHLDDDVPEMRRLDAGLPWRKVVILPSDSMVAHIPNNHDPRIKYRRGGASGVCLSVEKYAYTAARDALECST